MIGLCTQGIPYRCNKGPALAGSGGHSPDLSRAFERGLLIGPAMLNTWIPMSTPFYARHAPIGPRSTLNE